MVDTELGTADRGSLPVTRESGDRLRHNRVRRIARNTGLVLSLIISLAWFISHLPRYAQLALGLASAAGDPRGRHLSF
jgi:hypothetical protein